MVQRVFDVHTHFTIETSAIAEDAKDIGFAVMNKSTDEHLAFMDRLGITYSLLSCPTLKYLDDPQRCLDYVRQVNNAGAEIKKNYPDRMGFAASLPLPYVDAAVEELRRAWNELGASAVCLCSNYEGMYLGDDRLEPLFDALEDLGCPVIVHPAAPQVYPKAPITGQVLPMYEFITDTTRTFLDIFASGTLLRHPSVKMVVPHSGSCLPVALDRFHGIMRAQGRDLEVPLDQLYFDLACDAFPRGVPILLQLTEPSHILYGTDYPAIPEMVLKAHLQNAKDCPQLQGHVDDVLWNNAAGLFGRKL